MLARGWGEEDMGDDGPGYRISIVRDEYFLEIECAAR